MATMTFAKARVEVLAFLGAKGWKVATSDVRTGRPLKVPHATAPDGYVRLYFHPQAVHFTAGNLHSAQEARSLWVDIRQGGVVLLAALNQVLRFERSY